MNHYLWNADDRRADTGRYCYGTAACLSGDGHARHAMALKDVNCPACLETLPFKRALARIALGLQDLPYKKLNQINNQ